MPLDLNKAAFDLDGVVVDVVTPFLRLLGERYNYKGFTPEDVTGFDLAAVLGVPEEIVGELLVDLFERPIEIGARPYPGAARVLAKLGRMEPLLFITSRPSPEPITAWFEAILPRLPPSRFEVVATGDPELKLECLLERNRLYFIDDYLDTCIMLSQAGLKPFVFDQPWNRSDESLPRIKGWDELYRLFA